MHTKSVKSLWHYFFLDHGGLNPALSIMWMGEGFGGGEEEGGWKINFYCEKKQQYSSCKKIYHQRCTLDAIFYNHILMDGF